MNELNVGTREACQRLVDAGIVLETDYYWCRDDSVGWYIRDESTFTFDVHESIPAPCFAEVWRELPIGTRFQKGEKASYAWKGGEWNESLQCENNPTDALIELLIWVERQKVKE